MSESTAPRGLGRMEGKVALVFGAGSSGHASGHTGWSNGSAASALYAREGARVVAVDLVPAAAEATRDIILKEGGEAIAASADATKSDDVAAVVGQALAAYGRIDVLHNNVGVTIMGGPLEISEESWRRGLDLNLTSAFLACKHVLPVMIEQGKGAVVNISSAAGAVVNEYPYASYYASKAGLNHFTRAMAIQYAKQGIRVNAIMPGIMDTPLIYSQISGQYGSVEDMVAARNARSPTGRMGDAWDVARAALFLASDEAKYVNGVILPVDGGLTCL
ncbi:SDR family NAD(P)-dependent oxidoreductase [Enterovirga rhinocerotis]|uniref:NAD(P)-dependent dehydrogenase (Short-subunit alcohol dehydrogenase family) n=1 Tax=Enterovirga rhinocerotis TaxID=1339210 RepID=A0A4R7C5C3_9HYPH|nr:SDR family NAD(P)-dependent oxidoreductase [Enterovirga rhinocerotis]TDR93253.1 NAD(P)-dependent dehydrogenase (short-subunit alcohol dehydrogenase family) [Enterovirga rhinocerotis]